jgi:NitT/TauT family transport system substrate-binding protein
MMFRSHNRVGAGVGLVALLTLTTACGGADAGSESEGDLPVIVFQTIESDPASIPVRVIKEQGLDIANGFRLEELVVDPDASLSTFLLGESDIATDQDALTLTIAQQEGKRAIAFGATLNMMTGVVASDASGIETPEDLVGKRVGHFGVDSGTTTGIRIMMEEIYGIDIMEDFDLREAGAPALPELLASGEVDAIMNYEPFALRAAAGAPGHYVFQPSVAWREHTGGFAPHLALLSARAEWLDENQDLAIAARDAWNEAVDAIAETDYELLTEPEYAEVLALRDEEELADFVAYCAELPCYTREWSQQDIDGTNEWLSLFAERDLLIEETPAEPVMVLLEDYFDR